MSEDSELEAKIARLTGRIERHRAQDDASGFALPQHQPYVSDADYRRSSKQGSGYSHTHRGFHPYSYPRQEPPAQAYSSGQTGPIRSGGYRNRSLVLNASANGRAESSSDTGEGSNGKDSPGQTNGTQTTGWVSRHDRHKQLINNSVYEEKKQQRVKAMEETQKKKQLAREQRQKSKIMRHVQAEASHSNAESAQASIPEINIDGIRFLVADGGSKLIKASGDFTPIASILLDVDIASDEVNQARRTPKTTTIGGVKFHRSRHGNLYRSGLVKIKRSAKTCIWFAIEGD